MFLTVIVVTQMTDIQGKTKYPCFTDRWQVSDDSPMRLIQISERTRELIDRVMIHGTNDKLISVSHTLTPT